MPKKRSVVIWNWRKSVYVKEATKHAKTYFSKENDTCDLKLALQRSAKSVSYHITRILTMNGLLLCISASSYFFIGKYTLK